MRALGGAERELTPAELFKAASPAVVRVDITDTNHRQLCQGSGFLVSPDGYVVTNFHVIKDGGTATLLLANGQTCAVEGVAAVDAHADLALLKATGRGFACLELAAKQLPEIGSKVYAIGSPRGLTNSLSEGLVSGHREMDPGFKLIQTSAAISPGSSGGPLLAANGKVVGVTTLTLMASQNLNFAVPAELVAKLMAGRGSPRPLDTARGIVKPEPPTVPRTTTDLQKRFQERYAWLLEQKNARKVGETSQGFVEPVKEDYMKKEAVSSLVNAENVDRTELYALIAAKENITPEKVGERNAVRNFQRARPGDYLKGQDGRWTQKK